MIDAKEADKLFREYRETGDISIRNRLVENYIYVAEILAKKFAGRGVEYDDLFQVASEALISGVEKFDPELLSQNPPHGRLGTARHAYKNNLGFCVFVH